jgi:hypothetical protein
MLGPFGRSSGVPFKVGSGSFNGSGARSASAAFDATPAANAAVRIALVRKNRHLLSVARIVALGCNRISGVRDALFDWKLTPVNQFDHLDSSHPFTVYE